jgi:transposase
VVSLEETSDVLSITNNTKETTVFDHYIAVDWGQSFMAIARMTRCTNAISVVSEPSDLEELKVYLKKLRGRRILTIEESTTSQWLYCELKDYVTEIVICDPYRNHLLSEGPKSDPIDARKLVHLLKAGLIKPVFHTADDFIYFRKIISAYDDLVKAGVRLKNQRSALFRAAGLKKEEKELKHPTEQFVLKGIDEGIEKYEKEKARYEEEFERIAQTYESVKLLKSVPGIGAIGATKIAAILIDPARFGRKGKVLAFCGLIRLDRISDGKYYGSKKPRYCRSLKAVFKIAAMNVIGKNAKGPLKQYYEYLIKEKRYSDYNARHAVARRIAILAYGVFKSGKKFNPERLKCSQNL